MSKTVDVATELAALCPQLAADWAVTSADLDLPYVALGHLASRMVMVRTNHPDADFRPVFDEVEARIALAEPGVRNLIILGLLEALQNVDADTANQWVSLLGPQTHAAWVALLDIWDGRMSAEDSDRIVG